MSIRDQLTQLVRPRGQRDQEQRMAVQERDQAQTPDEEIRHRELRRLAGMSAEDRAWEQASLQRHRSAQDRMTTVASPASVNRPAPAAFTWPELLRP